MRVEIFTSLPDGAKHVRIAVFMKEQGFVDEFDALDAIAAHFVAFDQQTPVATCRTWLADDGYHLGRLAVLKSHRGQGLGAMMLQEAEDYVKSIGGESISLHAQCRAEAFYRKSGYSPYGEMDYDEGVEHIHMRKILK